MRNVFIYIGIITAILFAQSAEDNFTVNVRVEFISIELLDLGGAPYILYTTAELDPGDTASQDSIDGVWIRNQSNINVGLLAWAYDDSSYIPSDSMLWVIDTISGDDTCAVGIAMYNSAKSPSIFDVHWLTETQSVITSAILPDNDKYGYIYFVAPTDSVTYSEPHHRIKITIGAFPE